MSRHPGRRRAAVWVGAGLVLAGAVAFAVDMSTSRDSAAPEGPRTYCWGALSEDAVHRLTAPPYAAPGQPPKRYQDVAGDLAYPALADERCWLTDPSASTALPVLEFSLHAGYEDLQRPDWFGPQTSMNIPLGDGVIGAVSERNAWIEVPSCVGGDGRRFAQLVVRPRAERRVLAEVLLGVIDVLRARAGCTEPPLEHPVATRPPQAVPYAPDRLCGIQAPPPRDRHTSPGASPAPTGPQPVDPPLPERPTWRQTWAGQDSFLVEDCVVSDGTDPAGSPKIRVEILRGPIAMQEIAERQGTEWPGTVYATTFAYGTAAVFWGVCEQGPVVYSVGTKSAESLPTASQLLDAVLRSHADADACGTRDPVTPPAG